FAQGTPQVVPAAQVAGMPPSSQWTVTGSTSSGFGAAGVRGEAGAAAAARWACGAIPAAAAVEATKVRRDRSTMRVPPYVQWARFARMHRVIAVIEAESTPASGVFESVRQRPFSTCTIWAISIAASPYRTLVKRLRAVRTA